MKKLEIVIFSERSTRVQSLLQEGFSTLTQLSRSSFFIILGCYIPRLSDEDKSWLEGMVGRGEIVHFRCKEREDR